ncbi:sulfite exporter TauE/SafE family protein [Aestuariimicrobium ganziense]|uniref:sulfite exporter TauE/SafE family protein n=1 Tax=Aestuariimicrobium ganziense TaxID=2773677 RepID=UPI00194334CB|nr:sulfite exporter TauE/SafE family protein [Aestuariimicrobium ganziense]
MIWVALGLAALIIGISKTSVGGLAAVSVAIFAMYMPTKESTAAVLLLLILGDVVAVLRYRAHADWKLLVKLLPWVLPGLALGAWFMSQVDDRTLRRVIGVLLLISLAVQFITLWRQRGRTEPSKAAGSHAAAGAAGLAAGFTTMTANAAGPVMTLYLLAAKIDKMKFVGTGAWYFLIVNLTKVPFSASLGLFTWPTVRTVLMLTPVVLFGTWVGIKLLKALPQRLFENLAIFGSVVAAVSLLVR